MSLNIDIEKAVKDEIQKNIKENVERYIEKAKIEVEKNIRENMAKIVCGVFSRMDFMSDQKRMVITVNFD